MIEVEEITFSRGSIGGKEALFATTILDRQGLVTREYNLGIEIESHRIFGDYIGVMDRLRTTRQREVRNVDEARELADKFGMTEQMIEAAEEAKKREQEIHDKELLAEYQAVMVDICRSLGVEPRVDIGDPTYYQEVIDNAVAGLRAKPEECRCFETSRR